ncbi:MAG: hypothetical protein R8J41_11090 [Alphaproteobacteria bacterium]|nr:hypothetical protein [Alphaproteobacteria bacterium]
MDGEVLSPLEGPPYTHEARSDDGKPVITVYLSVLGPRGAKVAARASIFAGGVSVVATTIDALLGSPSLSTLLTAISSGPVAWACSRWMLRTALKTRRAITFTIGEIVIATPLGTRTYDRNVAHSFACLAHPRADAEIRRIAWIERCFGPKWFGLDYTPFYGRSTQLCFIYLNQRKPLADIASRSEAERIHGRLMAVSDVISAHAVGGRGQALSPATDWSGTSDPVIEQI